MSKTLKKILVTSASLIMFASVGANVNRMVQPAHTIVYAQKRTRTLKHSVRSGHHFHRAESSKYGVGGSTHMHVYPKHDTADRFLVPDNYFTNDTNYHYIQHLFNKYGKNKYRSNYGQVAYINGYQVKIGTILSGIIINGHHFRNDRSGCNAILYILKHPAYHYTKKHYRRVKRHIHKHVKKNYRYKSKKYIHKHSKHHVQHYLHRRYRYRR